jgi:hypothetical protein
MSSDISTAIPHAAEINASDNREPDNERNEPSHVAGRHLCNGAPNTCQPKIRNSTNNSTVLAPTA